VILLSFIIRLLYKDCFDIFTLSFYPFLHCLSCVCQLFIKDHDDDDDDSSLLKRLRVQHRPSRRSLPSVDVAALLSMVLN